MRHLFYILTAASVNTACHRQTHDLNAHIAGHEPAPIEIIDVHTHTSFSDEPEFTSGIMDNAATYRATWERARVVGGISHLGGGEQANRELADMPLLFCVGIGRTFDLREIEAKLDRPEYGCIKIYLGYVHRFAHDAYYHPIYKLAAKYDVPVVFHTGDTYSSRGKIKFSDPLTIDEVAVDFPDTRFVIAHMGNPWVQSAAEVAYKNPNVYIEGSAIIIGKLHEQSSSWLEEFGVEPLRWAWGYMESPEKLMFGSDWPLVDIEAYASIYRRAIPRQYWDLVFRENALKVFPKLAERAR